MSATSIALNRFGIGARPDQPSFADPKRWLLDQIGGFEPRPDVIANAPTSVGVAADLAAYQREQQALRQQVKTAPPSTVQTLPTSGGPTAAPQPPPPGMTLPPGRTDAQRGARRFAGREARQDYAGAVAARTASALATDTPFAERLVWFWANHFAVSADKLELVGLAGTLEFEAIRPHLTGRFADMALAVERHPAMLLYLDGAVSVGPASPVGQRANARGRRVGLNENLAREIMELHTLGVRSGYGQGDVTEFARALTGWTVAGIGRGPGARAPGTDGLAGDFVFAEQVHEPGDRIILGKRYPAGGVEQGAAVLADLANAPATARHVATKLARHFTGDLPPPAMVARLEAAFLRSGGDLPALYRALVDSPEAWVDGGAKFRTPWEWTIATYRALGSRDVQPGAIVGLLNQLGQPTWKPGQPAGYDDIAGRWAGPDAVVRRVEAAERFASRAPAGVDARALAPRLFPAAVGPATTQALARAESPAQALALLLVSPEMMRR